jgi:hypothetical protein
MEATEVNCATEAVDAAIAARFDLHGLSEAVNAACAAGIVEVNGKSYMTDSSSRMVPVEVVKPEHALEDQVVRKIIAFAEDLSAQVSRFRAHTVDDVTAFQELLAEKYGGKRGGKKGNVTLTSYDGCQKVVVQVQDVMTFGPELQVAKAKVDECIVAWSEGASDEIRALVEHAFQVDKEGRINRAALLQLRRLDIADPTWQAAMTALADAMRIIGSREYVRFYKRGDPKARWQAITVDLAAA